MKEAIITGPTGAVGAALIRRLLQEDFRIYAVVRPNSRRLNALPADPRVVRVFCDLSELNRLPELIPEPCEVFFHFAWAGTTGADRNDRSLQEKNVEYSLDALRAAKALSCSCFLFSGTQAEYGRSDTPLAPETPCHPENEYGKAKLEAGLKLKAEAETLGIRMIHVRILSRSSCLCLRKTRGESWSQVAQLSMCGRNRSVSAAHSS